MEAVPARPGDDVRAHRRDLVLGAGILAAFAIPRIVLAAARQPFFDELFTLWITRLTWTSLFEALAVDSGPPLYYVLVKLAGVESINGARVLSILLALVTCGVVLFCRSLGPARYAAAALLAVFPPHVYFSGEGRAYALASLAVAGAVLSAHEWRVGGRTRFLVLSGASLLVSVHSHYYGLLFLGTPLLAAERATWRKAAAATALTAGLSLPVVLLAASQPRGAVAWMAELGPLLPLQHLAFAARYPDIFLPPATLLLHLSALLLTVAIAWSGRRDPLALRFALVTLTPVLGAVVLRAAGVPIYFPVRFESILAVPFVLWMGAALVSPDSRRRLVLGPLCILLGAFVCVQAALAHIGRPPDPFRHAVLFLAARADPAVPVVASSYAYLEAESMARTTAGAPALRVLAFPREQALHPGWRARVPADQLHREVPSLPPSFLWIGEGESLEAAVLRSRYDLQPLLQEGGILVARAALRSI